MKREFSAGGIVFKTERSQGSGDSQVFNMEAKVLLTQHSQNHHWSFPKGNIEEGQTSEQAAIREVREEGGIVAEITDKVGYSKYVYTFNEEKIFKVVTYYLMKYVSGSIEDHDMEVEDSGWYTPDEALKQLSFSQDKQLLKKALELYGK